MKEHPTVFLDKASAYISEEQNKDREAIAQPSGISNHPRFEIIDPGYRCYTTKPGSSLAECEAEVIDHSNGQHFILTVKAQGQASVAKYYDEIRKLLNLAKM